MQAFACHQHALRQHSPLVRSHATSHATTHTRLQCAASSSGRTSLQTATSSTRGASASDPIYIERSDFRPNVGICVVNQKGMVFAARRLDDPRSWQLPQGGIDEGEQPVNAALRELWEETNISSVEVVTCMPKWVHYVGTTITKTSTPGVLYRYPGQRQKWYMLRFIGDDKEIDLDANHKEFLEWSWLPLHEITANVVPFKRMAYQQMAAEFGPRIQQLVTKGTVGFGCVARSSAATKKPRQSRARVPAYMLRLMAQRPELGLN